MKLRHLAIGLLSLGTAFALSPGVSSLADAQGGGGVKPAPKKPVTKPKPPKPKPPARIAAAAPNLIASTNAVKAKRAQIAQQLAPPRPVARNVTFGGNGVAGQQSSRRWSTDVNRQPAGGGGASRPSGNGSPPAAGNRRWSTETNRPPRREAVRGTKQVTKGDGSGKGKNKKLKTAKPSPNPSGGSRSSVTTDRSSVITRMGRTNSGTPTTARGVPGNAATALGTAYRALEGSRPQITAASQPPPPAGPPPLLPPPSGPPPVAPSRQTLQVPIASRPRNVKSARPPGG